MQITAVIIDDEQNNVDNLCLLIQQHCPQVCIVDTANGAEEGRAIILEHQPDLVFLDIQMPGKNGFDLLQSLNSYAFEVIFVTAFDQYGIQAVKFSAIDYLLKPINLQDLKTAVEKVVQKSHQKKQNLQLENLIHLLQRQQNKAEHRIALTTLREIRFVPTQQIIRCESSNNYTSFYLADGEKLVVSQPIYEFDEILKNYGFIRCHQSHLVNKACVKSWVKEDGGYLLLEDGSQIPISRNKRELVKTELGN